MRLHGLQGGVNLVQPQHRQCIKENPAFIDENQFFELIFKQKHFPGIIDNDLQMVA